MNFETRVQSLASLIEQEVADYFFLDTCVIGMDFIKDNNGIVLSVDAAVRNNIRPDKLKMGLRSVDALLGIIKGYANIGVTAEVVEELETRQKILETCAKNYGRYGRHDRSKQRVHGSSMYTSGQRKEREMLARLVDKEREIMEMLSPRVFPTTRTESLRSYEQFVIAASQSLGDDVDKNIRNELLVAKAMYKMIKDGQKIALVSNNSRMKGIALRTQMVLARTKDDNREIYDALRGGRFTIIAGITKERGFYIDHRSEEFREMPIAVAAAFE
ncbi:MAG: hypothetical protein AABY40_00355 [Nanoarchaeota archaeon]